MEKSVRAGSPPTPFRISSACRRQPAPTTRLPYLSVDSG